MKRRPAISDISTKLTSKRLAVILIAAASLVAFLSIFDYIKRGPRPMQQNTPITGTENLHIFIPKDGVKLAEKTVEVKLGMSEKQKADIIMSELKKEKCIPEDLRLYDFAAGEDGVVYLNFSKEILDDKINTAQEITMTYAIVNSFASSFSDIKKIQLLVEGQAVPTINGAMYIYKPVELNKGFLED